MKDAVRQRIALMTIWLLCQIAAALAGVGALLRNLERGAGRTAPGADRGGIDRWAGGLEVTSDDLHSIAKEADLEEDTVDELFAILRAEFEDEE